MSCDVFKLGGLIAKEGVSKKRKDGPTDRRPEKSMILVEEKPRAPKNQCDRGEPLEQDKINRSRRSDGQRANGENDHDEPDDPPLAILIELLARHDPGGFAMV